MTLFLWSLDHNSFRFWSVASVFELTELELSNESDFGVSVTICSSFGFFSLDDDTNYDSIYPEMDHVKDETKEQYVYSEIIAPFKHIF